MGTSLLGIYELLAIINSNFSKIKSKDEHYMQPKAISYKKCKSNINGLGL